MKLVIILSLFFVINSYANKKSIAVAPFETHRVDSNYSRVVSNTLIKNIPRDSFKVVTREDLPKISDEIALSEMGLTKCDETNCLLEYGNLLQVNQLIVGEVMENGGTYHLTVRRFDVKSGEILGSSTLKAASIDALVNDLSKVGRDLTNEKISPIWRWSALLLSGTLASYSYYSYNKMNLVKSRYDNEKTSSQRATMLGEDMENHERNMFISSTLSGTFLLTGVILWNF
jgi:TolB-like protein